MIKCTLRAIILVAEVSVSDALAVTAAGKEAASGMICDGLAVSAWLANERQKTDFTADEFLRKLPNARNKRNMSIKGRSQKFRVGTCPLPVKAGSGEPRKV